MKYGSTKETQVSDQEFSLDTDGFDNAAKISKELSDEMATLRRELDTAKMDLMESWVGEGRNTFEKKYRVLSQQFGDLSDDLFDISESIYLKEQDYIQADLDIAKSLDGKTERY